MQKLGWTDRKRGRSRLVHAWGVLSCARGFGRLCPARARRLSRSVLRKRSERAQCQEPPRGIPYCFRQGTHEIRVSREERLLFGQAVKILFPAC